MSNSSLATFKYGKLTYNYDLIYQDRKTISLTIKPNMGIVLKCPHSADSQKIEGFLKRKWHWMDRQLSFFEKVQQKEIKKEYLSGESFYYLGRQYQLVIKRGKVNRLRLINGKLLIETSHSVKDSKHNQKILEAWFQNKREIIFSERFEAMFQKFDYKLKPKLSIRQMSKRWGSFVGKERIILNPQLIHASKDCIDYVIIHELCHLKFKNHSHKFYQLLKMKCPKWEKIKAKLELCGVECR